MSIRQLDNARFHTAKRLEVPNNIIWWFQPPYSPDCNPIERFWAGVKTQLAWKLFNDLDELKQAVSNILTLVSTTFLASLTGGTLLRTQLESFSFNSINKVLFN